MAQVLQDPKSDPTSADRERRGTTRFKSLYRELPRYTLVLVLILLVAYFSVTQDVFATMNNVSALVGNQTVPIVLSIAILIPLVVGEFDISLAALMGLTSLALAQWTALDGIGTLPGIGLTLLLGLGVGAFTALLVVGLRVNSFIVTLGISTILAGAAVYTSQTIVTGVPTALTDFGALKLAGLPATAYVAVGIALVIALGLSQTPWGRCSYAVGAGLEASRLSGIKTSWVRTVAFLLGGTLAAAAGVLQTVRIGTASPTVGPEFLLPAFAAVFLGATMGRGGRYNVLGTLVAIAVLAVGINGLQLAGAAIWVQPVFNGAALVVAVLTSRIATDYVARARRKA
jgi:ribose transport system permease protein